VTLSHQGLTRRAIARAVRVSRNTVRKILSAHGDKRRQEQTALATPLKQAPRVQKLDAYKANVATLLERFPDITARRVFEELKDAGFEGGYTAVKVHVRQVRPKEKPEPSLVTPVYGPGKMAESDWSPHVIDFSNAGRQTIQAFSYVLPWSTRKYFQVYHRSDLHSLMDGHVAAFARFNGAAAECKYDGQKAVVLGWEGKQPLYNPRFLAFATYYEYRPRACRPYHPNDKPRTERSLWEFEQSFLNGRTFRDLDDMRVQLALWLERTCDPRPHRKLTRPRMEVFAEEQPHLVPLPAHPYDTARVLYRVCSIDGFISYDGNRYAVPYAHVTDILPVRITQKELFVYAADLELVARHELAPPSARLDIAPADSHQPWNRRGADLDQLKLVFASMGEHGVLFFESMAAAQGRNAGHHARQILLLRERYSTSDLDAALAHARSYGALEHAAIQRILAVRARPRRLAEYVAEESVRRFQEQLSDGDTCLRDLGEYDRLPAQGAKETPCQSNADPQPPKSSSSDSNDISNS
jgi:transposase